MKYSRDGDQLCSNFALAFAIIATIIVIIPQSTCSFLSINPAEVISMPDVWPPENIAALFPNITNSTLMDMITNGSLAALNGSDDSIVANESPSKRRRRRQQQEERVLQQMIEKEVYPAVPLPSHQRRVFAGDLLNELFPTTDVPTTESGTVNLQRNITASIFTVNLGPWLVGSYQIDGKCYRMEAIDRAPPPEPSLLASRAMGIVAAVSGFAGSVAALFNCGADDKTRRKRNKYIAVLYALATVSTWLIFLMANITACNDVDRAFDSGPLEGLVLKYGNCQCRAGCFLTIAAGCCFIVSVICVLTYSG